MAYMKMKPQDILLYATKNKAKKEVKLNFFNVYLVGESENGPTKIGVSHNVKSRVMELQVGNPRKLKCYGSRPFLTPDEAFKFEKKLHKLFKEYSISGEWFNLSARQIAQKTRFKYGKPSSKDELICKAVVRGLLDLPKNLT